MSLQLSRKYRFKHYLNGSHYIIVNGQRGETHPHTWEFSFVIAVKDPEFAEFRQYEKGINDFLKPLQNQTFNDVSPFTYIIPTLENMTEYFAEHFYGIIKMAGGELISIEASESPTHSYILDISDSSEAMRKTSISNAVDTVLDRMFD